MSLDTADIDMMPNKPPRFWEGFPLKFGMLTHGVAPLQVSYTLFQFVPNVPDGVDEDLLLLCEPHGCSRCVAVKNEAILD